MGVRDSWNELGSGGKILVGLLVGGVVLVVGLVVLVLLAAVVGSFVLGVGETSSASSAPQVSFAVDFDASAETVEITHSGGDSVDADALRIETEDRTLGWDDEDGVVEAGESTTAEASPGSTVRIVWEDGEDSMVLLRGTME